MEVGDDLTCSPYGGAQRKCAVVLLTISGADQLFRGVDQYYSNLLTFANCTSALRV
jgi:hypothetical protein